MMPSCTATYQNLDTLVRYLLNSTVVNFYIMSSSVDRKIRENTRIRISQYFYSVETHTGSLRHDFTIGVNDHCNQQTERLKNRKI